MRPADLGAMPAEAPPALAPEPRPAVFGEAAPTAGLEQGALPSWLQAMRPVDVQRPAITPETDAYEETVGVLAGMRGVLQAEPTVALPRKSTVPVHKMEVSEAEAALATLIKNLLSEDTQARPAFKRRVPLALPLERWAIVAVMLAAILVPYFIAPGLFALPITLGQDTQAAFNVIETLPTDKPALIAFDYEPGQRGELDPAAHAMVAHLMRRGVPVVAVSTRPAGAAVGEAVLQQATTDLQTIYHITYTHGVNYSNLGYIPGGPVGVLQFAANPSLSFSADFGGKFNSRATRPDEVTLWQTPLLSQVTGLSQFGLILLVEAAPDSARQPGLWIDGRASPPEESVMTGDIGIDIGTIIAFALTVAVLSYLIGDNPVYRLAIHIFVGAAAGYAVIIAYYSVIYPQLFARLLSFNFFGPGLPLLALLLVVFLLLKARPSTSRLGSVATAFLIGVGVAVAIGGTVTGTLFPQTGATFLSLLPANKSGGLDFEKSIEALVIILGTVATLGYFYYGARTRPGGLVDRPAVAKPIAILGQVFIGAAFGVMYAGALAASLAFFAQSLDTMWKFIEPFLGGG
ncbi:MAG: hypothetical protein HY784_01410 [Chloroflexi bacterium]|nr:hypothetical protein [Chloroflexota bacterium]